MQSTKVIFRKWRREPKSVIAIFPRNPGTLDPYTCDSYEHVGQHGSCDPLIIHRHTIPARPEEYADLKAELERLGYIVSVGNRITQKDFEIRLENIKPIA